MRDEAEFLALYREHQAALFRYAYHMTGSRDQAEEILQETFVALLRKTDNWPAERAYLLGVARNMVRRGWNAETFDELEEESATLPDFFDDITRAERIAAVRESLLTLPEPYREAIVLCDMEEMTYEQAAPILRCPVGTVRSRLNRGRALLAAKLKGKWQVV